MWQTNAFQYPLRITIVSGIICVGISGMDDNTTINNTNKNSVYNSKADNKKKYHTWQFK